VNLPVASVSKCTGSNGKKPGIKHLQPPASVRAGDLQNGEAFSIIDRRNNLNRGTPFLMERPLHFRGEHNTFYLAFVMT